MEYLIVAVGVSVLVGIGVVIGIALSVLKSLKKDNTKVNNIRSFDELIKEQEMYDDASGAKKITNWFREKGSTVKSPVYFLSKPTKETAEMFALANLPDNIDPNTNLIQAVVDKESKNILAVRLISFQKIPDELLKQFNGKDYIIFKQ